MFVLFVNHEKVGESGIPLTVTAFTLIRWHMEEYHNGLH
jgi:hypothetical protein